MGDFFSIINKLFLEGHNLNGQSNGNLFCLGEIMEVILDIILIIHKLHLVKL